MKKTMMCLTAVAWLWIAKGQERGTPQRDPQKPVKTQRIVSFKSDDRSPEKTLQDLLNPGKELKFVKLKSKKDDQLHVVTDVYDQYYKGVRVEGGQIRVVKQNGKLKYALQDYAEISTTINTSPKLSKEQALSAAIQKQGAKKYAWQEPEREKSLKERKKDPAATYYPKPELVVLSDNGQLAYKMEVYALDPFAREQIFVDAQSGEIIRKNDLITHEYGSEQGVKYPKILSKKLNISLQTAPVLLKVYGEEKETVGSFDNQSGFYYLNDISAKIQTQQVADIINQSPAGSITPYGSPFATNNWTTGDFRSFEGDLLFGQRVHYGMENANSYFLSNFNRLSYDGAYSPLNANLYNGFMSSFYAGEQELFFGFGAHPNDADIKVSPSLQTVYHEYAHAVTISESGLNSGLGEQGSLNEALSDMWSYVIADKYLKQNPYSGNFEPEKKVYESLFGNTWKTTSGNDAFLEWYKNENGYSVIRDSKNPHAYNYPAFYQGKYWNTEIQDKHINSTVISHWFYLLSEGATVSLENDPSTTVTIPGIGIEKAAQIIYLTSTNFLSEYTDFYHFALETVVASKIIFGENSPELNSLIVAWQAVGINQLDFSSQQTCIPPAGYETSFYVKKFELANIQNDKPKEFTTGYSDYTFLNINVHANNEYDIYLTAAGSEQLPKDLYWSIWIDLNKDNIFDINEKVFSAQGHTVKSKITIPQLSKSGKSFMRVVLSSDITAGPCYNPVADKSPKYIEDYGVNIQEYCPIINWTSPDFKKKFDKFTGLKYNNIRLVECGGNSIFDVNPANQQKLIDASQQTLVGGQSYSLMFNLVSQFGVLLYPINNNVPNQFLSKCGTQPPSGFNLELWNTKAKEIKEDDTASGGGCGNPIDDPFCPGHVFRFVWIDFNRDGQFSNQEGYFAQYDFAGKCYYVNFVVPNSETTLNGLTSIRIYTYLGNRALFGGDACGNGENGWADKFFGNPVLSETGMDILINLKKDKYYMNMSPAPDNNLSDPAPEAALDPVSLTVYPNPASNLVDLSLKGTTTDNFTLELYDSNGNRLLVKQPWDGRALDISKYPAGIYLVTLRRDREVYTQKLMIER